MSIFKHPTLKIVSWVVAEVILNLIGFDDLADYSEFILHKRVIFSEATIIESHSDTGELLKSIPVIPAATVSDSESISI